MENARRALPPLGAALVAILAARYVAGEAWTRGFPLDDAWIHMVYGLALRTERLLAYNDGAPATGATSPLWAACVGLAHLVTAARGPSMQAAMAVKALGVTLHGASAWLAVDIVSRAAPRNDAAPAAAGILVAIAPIGAFAAVSGMEISLTSALLLGAFAAMMRARARLAGLLGGLAVVARPECVVVVPFLALAAVFVAPRPGPETALARARRALQVLALGLAPALVVALRNWRVSGRPLPATFYQKARAPHLDRVDVHARFVFDDMLSRLEPYGRITFAVLLACALVSGVLAVRRLGARRTTRALAGPLVAAAMAAAALAWVLGLLVTVGLPVPDSFYHQRYYVPVLPVAAVAAMIGLAQVMTLTERPLLRGAILALPLLLLFVAAGTGLPAERARYARDVAAIDRVQVGLARVVADAPPGTVAWSQDAGAYRYFGRKLIVDLCRLNTPELLVSADMPPNLSPRLVVVPPSLWDVTGDVEAVGEATPEVFVERASRQVVYRCAPGGKVSVSFRGVRVASGRCAD